MNRLPFSRFLQLESLIFKAKYEELQEKFILAAFVGWQLGAAGKKTFGEHLVVLGLSDKTPQDDNQKESAQRVEPQKSQDVKLSRMGIKAKG